MKIPLVAIMLTVEITGIGQKFLIPLPLAVAGSISIFHLCGEYADQPMRESVRIRVTNLLLTHCRQEIDRLSAWNITFATINFHHN